ncbi:MAG TPA: DUF1003 domain-containing protein [Steroidobacteraceae bacterium]|jgi:uncharacterized membrane protein|nr:DUF1003 domain-containing protein [Steroidobacteraceae bacterium]
MGNQSQESEALDSAGNLSPSARGNLELLTKFEDVEDAQISGAQLLIERISAFFGSPAYFAFAVSFIILWMLVNGYGVHAGWRHVDPPPYFWLQGLVSSNALLLTVAVLIRQNRMAKVAAHRSHLDLQINLLSEQKVTKILQLVDELRRELTALRGRPDSQVDELTKPADAHAMMHAIKQQQTER